MISETAYLMILWYIADASFFPVTTVTFPMPSPVVPVNPVFSSSLRKSGPYVEVRTCCFALLVSTSISSSEYGGGAVDDDQAVSSVAAVSTERDDWRLLIGWEASGGTSDMVDLGEELAEEDAADAADGAGACA
jgi:hypothetical protein